MRFEKLEERCVRDVAGIGGFCVAFESPAPTVSGTVETPFYGPLRPTASTDSQTPQTDMSQGEPETGPGDGIELLTPLTKVDYTGPVIDVPEIYLQGSVAVAQQDVPASTGLRAALDILEANSGFAHAWANAGINAVYRSGDIYYFQCETPYMETLVLGQRVLLVDIGDGIIYSVARF